MLTKSMFHILNCSDCSGLDKHRKKEAVIKISRTPISFFYFTYLFEFREFETLILLPKRSIQG